MEFLIEHKDTFLLLGGTILGVIIAKVWPKSKTHALGRKLGERISRKTALELADHIDAFEHGLRNEEYQGDKNLISNQQLTDRTEKLKIDLGLEQKSKEKELK